mgnify:CR=1 FL=1
MFRNRIYKSGTGIQWCFWRWSDAQEPYLTRLFIFKTPWFALSYNHIKQADVGHPHDHTASFLSIFFWGWYKERRIIELPIDRYGEWGSGIIKSDRVVKRSRFNFIKASPCDRHRIIEVSKGGSHSLCFMGPKKREWYYHTPDGMVHWAKYKEMNPE